MQGNSAVPQLGNGCGFVAVAIDADGNASEPSVCRPYVVDGPLPQDGFESP